MVTINCPSAVISATMPVISSAFLRQMQYYMFKVLLLTLDVHCLPAALYKCGVFALILTQTSNLMSLTSAGLVLLYHVR